MRYMYKNKIVISYFLVGLLLVACLFSMPLNSYSKEDFLCKYNQKVYTISDGLGSLEANCVYQSSNGYIWVGTNGGLYRSSGSGFTAIELWDIDKSDVYSINSIIEDSNNKIWVATDNYGLFCIDKGVPYHYSSEYYNGIKRIYDVAIGSDGKIYVAASNGLYYINELNEFEMVDKTFDNREINGIVSVNNELWCIVDSSALFQIEASGIIYNVDVTEFTSNELTCISKSNENSVFVGTMGNEVLHINNKNSIKSISTSKGGIRDIYEDLDKRIWVCADNGIGYLQSDETFVPINDLEIENYLTSIVEDYEGNYWISSSRMGLVLVSISKFQDFNMQIGLEENTVNSIFSYKTQKYIGTDNGLVILDATDSRVSNDLTELLNGISIRYITNDTSGNLWISTYRKYGVIKVDRDGNFSSYTRVNKLLSNSVNYTIELNTGNIAVATDEGITIITKSGEFVENIGGDNTFNGANISCLYEDENGRLFVGTEGQGLFIVEGSKLTNYMEEQGLSSNFISTIVKGNNGLWIGTKNGLSYYEETFRTINNVDFSNNIYDIILHEDKMYLIGSRGLLITTESELLGNDGISKRYYDSSDGLNKTLSSISDCIIDSRGILYLCCNTGIITFDINNYVMNLSVPKVRITSVEVNGHQYAFDDLKGKLEVDSRTDRIRIEFAILSYVNRDYIEVTYKLEGFDKEPIVVKGTEVREAVYTNLDGGEYEFTLSAKNGDGVVVDEKISLKIIKEKSMLESTMVRVIFALVSVFLVCLFIFVVFKIQKLLVSKNRAIEKLSKEHEVAVKSSYAKNDYLANMSNEIKTTINAIMAKADELLRMNLDDEQRENVDIIRKSGDNIIDKVEDIILLAKLEAGKIKLKNEPYSLTTLVCELSDKTLKELENRQVKFYVQLDEDLADGLIGDGVKIKEMIWKLLDNAIKYTKEGSITLSIDSFEYNDKENKDIANIVFSISDTGIGIPTDRLENIFEVYSIVDNKKGSKSSGSGLGISIAKHYCDMMQGEIEVESVYGAGTTFTISLTQKKADEAAKSNLKSKLDTSITSEEAQKIWLPDVNALLVDDDEVSRTVALGIMEKMEMKVDVATSAISTIDMVLNNEYDIVLVNLVLPIMNGLDVLNEIRDLEGERYKSVPVIGLSSDAMGEDVQEKLELGFSDVLYKPLSDRTLITSLKKLISNDKIKERTEDISLYIKESRFGKGLVNLSKYINIERALEKIGGTIEVYNKVIISYSKQVPTAIEDIMEKLNSNMRGFKMRIHAIKIACQNIGAYSLANQAAKIEAAANFGNKEYIFDNIDDLLINVDELLSLVSQYIVFMEEQSGIKEGEVIQNNQVLEIKQEVNNEKSSIIKYDLLDKLKTALVQWNIDSINQIMVEIISNQYTGEEKEFLEVLVESIEENNDEAAIDLINTYIELKM